MHSQRGSVVKKKGGKRRDVMRGDARDKMEGLEGPSG